MTIALWVSLPALCAVCGWGLCGYLWRQNRNLRERLAAAEIRRLRTQINPHFLYNALNAIAELGYDDPRTADRVVTQLSQLLRKALDDSHLRETALRDELTFLERYLDIQRVLLRDKLEATVSAAPQTLSARLPGMILQPLLENALTHGAGAGGAVCIRVDAKREGDTLTIDVADKGPGLPPGDIEPSAGIGIANIRARLRHLYGDRARLALRNRDGGGLMARITIPFHEGYAYDEAARTDR